MGGETQQIKMQIDTERFGIYNKRRMGRPPKPKHLRRSKMLPIRLTEAEFHKLDREAGKLGITVAELLRQGARLLIQMKGEDGSSTRKEK